MSYSYSMFVSGEIRHIQKVNFFETPFINYIYDIIIHLLTLFKYSNKNSIKINGGLPHDN